MLNFNATTIICVRKKNNVVIGGDGQVTFGNTILKKNAEKIKFLFNDTVMAGFSGSTADAFTLFEKFEEKLELYHGNMSRAIIEFGKHWRSDKIMRKLEALLIIADIKNTFLLSGNGDIIEPENDVIAIGSGGQLAYAAALALIRNTELEAKDIVKQSLKIASDICIYTNSNLIIKELKIN